MPHYIITRSGDTNVVTLVLSGKPVTVTSNDSYYAEVLDLLKTPGTTDEDISNIIFKKVQQMEAAVLNEDGFSTEGGIVRFEGLDLPEVLSDRILSMAQEGFDVGPLKLFVKNLVQNPSRQVFTQLYQFLERGKLALTEDGCFLAYKKVRDDYRDIYSNSFDNSVGRTVRIPRIQVDDNPSETCSSGLHVCSYDYLAQYGDPVGEGTRVVACKVNPRDVVAVPVDYEHTKMRVCEYQVVAEVTVDVAKDNDVLQGASVMDADEVAAFAVEVRYYEESPVEAAPWSCLSRHARLSEAFEEYNRVLDDIRNNDDEAISEGEIFQVRVVNLKTQAVLETAPY